MNKPISRSQNIVVQELDKETLICDLVSNQVFCLNSTLGEVWKLCDGEKTVFQISETLSKKQKTTVGEDIVVLSLVILNDKKLLQTDISNTKYFDKISRRELVRKVGLASMIALPLISSIIMPLAAHAASQSLNKPNGAACASGGECSSNSCADGVCCDTTCTGTCMACSQAKTMGSDGTCMPITPGTDPDNECFATDVCDGTGRCVEA